MKQKKLLDASHASLLDSIFTGDPVVEDKPKRKKRGNDIDVKEPQKKRQVSALEMELRWHLRKPPIIDPSLRSTKKTKLKQRTYYSLSDLYDELVEKNGFTHLDTVTGQLYIAEFGVFCIIHEVLYLNGHEVNTKHLLEEQIGNP